MRSQAKVGGESGKDGLTSMDITEFFGMGREILGTGWMIALPIMHMAGFVLAFIAGGLLAVGLRRKSTESQQPPAKALQAPGLPLSRGNGLVFGHEMKNYLCALRGNARLLRLGVQGTDQASIIDRIDRVVEKLESFAWNNDSAPDVLVSRTREAVDMVQTAQNCSGLHFSGTGIKFSTLVSTGVEFTSLASPGGEMQPLVQGDPYRLDQIFQNLYGNSREAGATRIVTRFRRIGGELEIAIEDNGRGCPEQMAARIFQPFFSTKKVTAPQGEAAGAEGRQVRGLGLFVVQSIVENHGGRIRASSKNGRGDGDQGLVVYLHFPLFSPLFPSQKNPAPSTARLDTLSMTQGA